jgi:alpha-D-ribose 1-methylphosphonate 5-triphosphate synthase subunit PhnH
MTLDRPGFADPVADSQACFRALLDAMSRPGTLREAGAGLAPPAPLAPATAAALLTLVDGDAPLWLDEAAAPAWDWLAFHCGAARAGSPDEAAFACALDMPRLSALPAGGDAEPEASATLVLQVTALDEGRAYRLSGPGLRVPARLQVAGLPDDFAAQWAANHALYPRGVDLVLCAGARLCALPRSVRIEEA